VAVQRQTFVREPLLISLSNVSTKDDSLAEYVVKRKTWDDERAS